MIALATAPSPRAWLPIAPSPAAAPPSTRHHHNVELVTPDGIALSVYDSRPDTADHTVVYLHGLCLNRTSWTPHVNRLLSQYWPSMRVISYDHRGHGSSAPAPINTYTIDQLADDLAYLLSALRVRHRLTLVGHSMGGMAALAYLSRPPSQRPIDPCGLVLIATAAGKLSQRGLGRLLSTPATAALAHAAGRTPERVLRGLIKPLCATLSPIRHHLPAGTIASVTLTALSTTAPSTAIGYLPSLRTYDLSQTLAAVRARTVIVSGGVDPFTPPQHARELAAAIPGATHLHIPTAGHMLPQQAPEAIHRAITHASGLDTCPRTLGSPGAARRPAHVVSLVPATAAPISSLS